MPPRPVRSRAVSSWADTASALRYQTFGGHLADQHRLEHRLGGQAGEQEVESGRIEDQLGADEAGGHIAAGQAERAGGRSRSQSTSRMGLKNGLGTP